MAEPRRIRVLYFDSSPDTLEKFAGLCGERDIIELVGAFRSFPEIAPLLERDDYRFAASLEPDVAVLRLSGDTEGIAPRLKLLRSRCGVKLVGLLSGECAEDRGLIGALDYHTELASADSPASDEDVYTRLAYQIKTARLALNTERSGVKGKWVVLPLPPRPAAFRGCGLIAIGASAGGTEAVSAIMSELPHDLPPVLIVQHIPDNFTEFFAKNLAARTELRVAVAHGGERLEDGCAYIAGDGKHLEVARGERGGYFARCTAGEKISGHRPSVDALFSSAARAAGSGAIGVILTGMGSDGARGLLEMREAGAYTIGQDRESSAVYGMPMAARALGAVTKQLPLSLIAKAIVSAAKNNGKR